MIIEWRKLLSDHAPISLPSWEGDKVYISTSARDSIYEQLLALKGKRVIDLIPADEEDWKKYKELTLPNHYTTWKPEEYEAARKIGVLTDISMNIGNLTSPTNEIFGKVSIDDSFKEFQWKAYTLYIGLDDTFTKFDYEKADDGWNPKNWNAGFTISECKVKGLYFKKDRSSNDYDFDTGMRNYYHLRNLGMYVYLPGRGYY